ANELAVEYVEPVDGCVIAETGGKVTEVIMRNQQRVDTIFRQPPAQENVLPQAPEFAQCQLKRRQCLGIHRNLCAGVGYWLIESSFRVGACQGLLIKERPMPPAW